MYIVVSLNPLSPANFCSKRMNIAMLSHFELSLVNDEDIPEISKRCHSDHSTITYTYLKVDQVLSCKGALKSSILYNSQRHEGSARKIHVLQGVGVGVGGFGKI